MSGAVLITRPLEESLDFARDLAALGYESRVEPLLEITDIAFTLPRPADAYAGLILTSVQAVRAAREIMGAGRVRPLSPSVYAVGSRTAEAARQAGFTRIEACAENGRKLFNHLALTPPGGPLLYLRGEETAFPLEESLRDIGIACESTAVYEAVPALGFSPETRAALANGEIGAVTLFSARTARVFAELYARELPGVPARFKVLCFSESVLEYVRPLRLKEAYVCAEATRKSMISLLRAQCPVTPPRKQGAYIMTQTNSTPDTLGNAEEIIERFGGIRPMSTKTNIPVTTIQGWKKRGAIPLSRLDDLLKAAKNHNVKLEDLVEKTGAPANENATAAKPAPVMNSAPVCAEPQKISVSQPPAYAAPQNPPRSAGGSSEHEKIKAAMVTERQKALVQSVAICAGLIVLIGGAAAALLWPEFEDTARATRANSETLAALQSDVTAVKGELEETKSMFSGFLPGDWQQQLDTLKEQAAAAQASARQAMEQAQQISQDVIGENAGTIQQRLDSLGQHLAALTGSPLAQSLMGKFSSLAATPEGSGVLDSAVNELNALLQSAPAPVEGVPPAPVEETLEAARGQSGALGQAFEGVPAEDLKAAALLLGFSQFRSSLGRDNQSFAEDLSLLKTLLGEGNPALSEAIDRLAPNAAEQGVLTPSGLTSELQSMTGDIVVASLKGENVSVAEKAQAHFGEILRVEKNGEMLTGTPVQQKLAKTESLMQEGQLEQAIAVASTLEGPAGQMIQPWLEKARRTLQAQNLGTLLEGGIVETLSGAGAHAGLPLGGQLVEDKASGVILYRPAPQFVPPKAAMP